MNMKTKKVTFKKEFESIASGLAIQEQEKGYKDCAPVYEYRSGTFRCSIDTDRITIEEQIANLKQVANRMDRDSIIISAELNRRCSSFQKALAYIGENRHLIPFFNYINEYVQSHSDKSVQDAIRAYRKRNTLPAEIVPDYSGWGKATLYGLGGKSPDIYTVLAQLPYIPKAWIRQ